MQAAPPPESPGKSPAAQSALQQALRQALPQQIPLGDALNQLVQLSQTPAVRGQGAIGQLVQSMLSLFSVTPGSPDADQAIQRNLQQGGLLTESQLARSGNSDKPPLNLKQQLGQLLKAAEQLPPEPRQQMQRLVEALQARSTSQQVSSLQAWKELPDGGQERVFRLDIPIRLEERHDNAELTITEQRRPDPDGEYQSFWNVALSFDLHQQGSVDVRLSLHEGWRLQLQFWAEALPTLRRIEQQLDPFTQTLHDKGFIVDHIQARQGKPQQPKLNDIQRRLVDVHT
ncbi:flagellar hook-length control protein FliK [Marinobacterium sediminicola]|nr:flagellar hook-length control protein FliK [Marinobacterium sediminicola]ULG68746.1 flagellar hook-length control protein FliK [Marinobacterium sediminicola]